MDDDGITIIGTVNVADGNNALFHTVPTKAQAGNLKYSFSGWSPEGSLMNVTEDRVVYATYTETAIPSPPTLDTGGSGEESESVGSGNGGNNLEIKFLLPISGVIVLVAAALVYLRRH